MILQLFKKLIIAKLLSDNVNARASESTHTMILHSIVIWCKAINKVRIVYAVTAKS